MFAKHETNKTFTEMIYQKMIEKYRSLKKQSYLKSIGKYNKTYAFLGVGPHSLQNLYPCLQHFNVKLKYIYSRTIANARKISQGFPGSEAVDSYSRILEDKDVEAVFISLRPSDQQATLIEALHHGKNVFVEKPPCSSASLLEKIISINPGRVCFPAFQRRYSAINQILAKHRLIKSAETYRYVFHTGGYPDGDIFTELFIHPIDFIIHLFGDFTEVQIQTNRGQNGITCHLQLIHKNGVKGQVELSSQYAWNNLIESLEVNTAERIINIHYPNELYAIEKPAFFNFPVEKIIKGP